MIRRSAGFLTQIYALADFSAIQISFFVAWWIKFESGLLSFQNPLPIQTYLLYNFIYGGIAVIVGVAVGFYTPKRKKRFSYELARILQVHFVSLLLLLSLFYIFRIVDISREFLMLYLAGNIVVITCYRLTVKEGLKRLREKGYNKQYVLILGAGSLGRRFYHNLSQYPILGYEVLGFLDDYQQEHPAEYADYRPIIGTIDSLESTLNQNIVDEVIIALPLNAHHKLATIIGLCEKAGVKALIIPDYYDYLPARPYFDNFAGIPLINIRDIPLDELKNRFIKRTFDIVFSLACIFITLPLFIFIAGTIKLTSPGPVIFKQERVGLNRRTFQMYKFRSMHIQSDDQSDRLWTVKNDPRRTKIGTFLRKTSLDELPQFFNVLIGHMSVVGPRPERPFFVEQFKEDIPKYMVKHHIRPGITGWAQINGLRGDTSIKERIRHDIFYIENWTLFFDIKIIIKTIINGFINKNAY